MRIVRDIAELRRATAALPDLAFVPTMGNLHDGHLALVRLARGRARHVAASIFVNRLQFAPHEDFDRYPRTFAADCARLEAEGVELLFAPDETILYPEPQQVIVEPPPIAHELEGAFRPRFFHGVPSHLANHAYGATPITSTVARPGWRRSKSGSFADGNDRYATGSGASGSRS